MLEMRVVCEKCSAAMTDAGDALICSFECTFCVACGESMDYAYVRTVAVNLSNVRVALPSNFITTGCLNQWRRASLWSQHTTACVR